MLFAGSTHGHPRNRALGSPKCADKVRDPDMIWEGVES